MSSDFFYFLLFLNRYLYTDIEYLLWRVLRHKGASFSTHLFLISPKITSTKVYFRKRICPKVYFCKRKCNPFFILLCWTILGGELIGCWKNTSLRQNKTLQLRLLIYISDYLFVFNIELVQASLTKNICLISV